MEDRNSKIPGVPRSIDSKGLLLIHDRAGEVTTAELARRLKVSSKDIQRTYQALQISPLDNDGRYTAAEVARLIGVPPPTLIDWLKEGKVPAAKVGPYWRIEVNNETSIEPSWNGKTLHKSDPETTGSGAKRDCCANCDNKLFFQGRRQADYWCSKICRGEYIQILGWRQQNDPRANWKNFPAFLRPNFQDYLVGLGIIRRDPPTDLSLRVKANSRVGPVEKKVWRILRNYRDYVVPKEVIHRELYTDDNDINTQKIDVFTYRIRDGLRDQSLLKSFIGRGLSLNVEAVSLTRFQLMVFRQIYQKRGLVVPVDYLKANLGPELTDHYFYDAIKKINHSLEGVESPIAMVDKQGRNGLGASYLFSRGA
jgi:excisionase family DNA binding protein